MSYEYELIRKDQLQVANWSGGTTTQLAIFPKDAIYSERNFKWRLSSAKVKVEESVFTALPNINRIIMIIDGELILEHEGHHRSILKPFDQDHFSGSWTTKSFGKVTDFNLMMTEGCEGELEAIHIESGQSMTISFNHQKDFSENVEAIYCVNGQIIINDKITLYAGDIVLITQKGDFGNKELKMYNENNGKTDVIRVSIHY